MARIGTLKGAIANFKAVLLTPSALEAVQDRTSAPIGMVATGPGPFGQTNLFVSQAVDEIRQAQYGWIYRKFPAVRTVVDLIARNVSQLALRLYEQGSENESTELYDHPALLSVERPNPQTPGAHWIRQVVTAYLVYNDAYAVKFPNGPQLPTGLWHMPSEYVGILGPSFFQIAQYRIYDRWGGYKDVDPEQVIHWRGINPLDPRNGVSALETLRNALAEDIAVQTASTELAKAGNVPPGHLWRPLEAPQLDGKDAERVVEIWQQAKKNPGKRTALLEEGMKYETYGISPKDAQALDGRRFTKEEVATLYGVPLGMVGLADFDEKAQLEFYQDVLAPLCELIASFLDIDLLEETYGAEDLCFKFDLDEKLRGNPIDRYQALTAAAGRPWKTVNETREGEDLPPIEGGDKLTIPSNVILAGEQGDPNAPQLPAPNVMPPQDPNEPPQDGSHREASANGNGHKALPLVPVRAQASHRRDRWAKEYEVELRAYYAGLRTKSADDDLAKRILGVSQRHFATEGHLMSRRLASEGFDPSKGANWLRKQAEGSAADIDRVTRQQISQDGLDVTLEGAEARASGAGKALASTVAAFASRVAVEQAPNPEFRTVSIDGGDCEICAPFQGSWPFAEVPGWPGYHANCGCVAVPA